MRKFLELLRRKKRMYQEVFDTNKLSVRRVLADLRSICPDDPTTGAEGGTNEKKVYINIGKRKVYNHIMSMLMITDKDIMVMSREANEEKYNGTDEY